MRLELSAFVEGDLDRIAAHIAEDNPRRAVTFVCDIRMKLAAVAMPSYFAWRVTWCG